LISDLRFLIEITCDARPLRAGTNHKNVRLFARSKIKNRKSSIPLEVFEVDTGAAGHAGEGIFRQSDIQTGGVADYGGQTSEQGATAGHCDAVIDQVGR
jgi:hypothetical protein